MHGSAHLKIDTRINTAPSGYRSQIVMPAEFYYLLSDLHRQFTPRQQQLILRRRNVLRDAHAGNMPDHTDTDLNNEEWKVTLPYWCRDQRNQMTGPADDAELVVKMLNSGAPGVMLDLEDSMANTWENLERGIRNSLAAIHGELEYFDKKRDRNVAIEPSNTVTWVRVRGLHLNQANVIGGEIMSASVYDACRIAFGFDRKKAKHNLCFYIPKSESADEALFWRDLFQTLEERIGWERGFIKCMALVESHPFAYQMDEFIYNLREHITGLNLGRWDYMASLIHFNLEDKDWVLPDRNTIPSDVPFFQNLRHLLVDICHKRGILAIGGMTALYPSRADRELNKRALKTLEIDKGNEAGVGMDGAWTGHPDQNEIAVAQFPIPNQNFIRFGNVDPRPDLRPKPSGVGKHTLDGTRAAVSTIIRYRYGVLCGKGASLIDGYMEDLATDRIYRLMIAQRIKHRRDVEITDGEQSVEHTRDFIHKIFGEELDAILKSLPQTATEDEKQLYIEAARISEAMITNGQFDPI